MAAVARDGPLAVGRVGEERREDRVPGEVVLLDVVVHLERGLEEVGRRVGEEAGDGADLDLVQALLGWERDRVGDHERAERRPDQGGYAGMAAVIDGNAQDFAGLPADVLPAEPVAALNRAARAALEARRGLLEERREAARVRHCHGDLHLGNIVRRDGEPVLFDCIEFSEAFACTDVLYDLAFLLMDLIHRDLMPHAWRLLNGYLDATRDDGGLACLPLFLSCRAAIRAKVHGLAAGVPEDPATGSAACTLGGYLGMRNPRHDGTLRWVIEQGFEMGRPSTLHITHADGHPLVGGKVIPVAEGRLLV